MEEETWKYILINGKFRQLGVKNPTFDKGALATIEGLKPFDKKDKLIEPTSCSCKTLQVTLNDTHELQTIKNNGYEKNIFPFHHLVLCLNSI